MQKYIDDFKLMLEIRGLTDNTMKSYISYLKAYLNYVQTYLHKTPEMVDWGELRGYIYHLKNIVKLNPRSINAHISQLRFFYLYVLHKPWDKYQMPFHKFDTYLPLIISQKEMHYFIHSMENLKHKAISSLMYSSGLRVSEARSLKYKDISRANMTIYIARSKNRSDRYAILSENALNILTQYWYAYGKPKDWLFPSTHNNGNPIVSYTVLRFIKDHEKRLGWEPRLSCHSLRHCFGTHLYENGADLITIKNLLGHKSLNSTTIYVHLGIGTRNKNIIISPFDKPVSLHNNTVGTS